MGTSASKPARAAANAARRQYPKQPTSPTTAPPTGPKPQAQQQQPPSPPPKQPTPETHAHGPAYHSKEQPSSVKSDAIDLDARDPHFAASLRSIGPVTPAPTLSHSSTFNTPQQPNPNQPLQTVFPQTSNPALLVISARQRVAKAAEKEAEEFGKQSHTGREYLDVLTIRQALAMRDHNRLPESEIERVLRLKKGVMGRFGGRGVVGEIR